MKWACLFTAVAVAGSAAMVSEPARAGDAAGAAVAGGIAGFVGGMIVGNAMHPHRPPPPAYVYVDDDPPPPPVYCHWANGRAYWDDYEGIWRHRRVRVCE